MDTRGSTTATAATGALLAADPPRFSPAEHARRRGWLQDQLAAHGLDRAVVYGANRTGSAVAWLSGWPVTREAVLFVEPDEPDLLLVQFRNHVPQATQLARPGVTVGWAGPSTADRLRDELAARGAGTQRVGVIGPLPHSVAAGLASTVGALVSLDAAHIRARLVKSPEEIEWLRAGAHLSDAGIAGITAALAPGLDERGIVDAAERAYVPRGGRTHICYVMTTAMDAPDRAVPAQYPTTRALRHGDVISVELSASFWDHAGQVLRTFTLGGPPTAMYAELHDVAVAAFDAVAAAVRPGATSVELRAAAGVIEDAGHTTIDDLVHGFGGGYLPPVVTSRSHIDVPLPEITLQEGMTIVVQPNVVTRDGRAGVQTGELVLVTAEGSERLHASPPGLIVIDTADQPAGARR